MIIEVNNLVKRYKELIALDHFRLEVEEGEILGLLGPNGSGKTTAINCMLALLTYDKGDIRIFGKQMKADSYDLKQQIGVVPQNVTVFHELSVEDNINYFCGLYVSDKAKRKTLVDEAIRFVSLEEFRKVRPGKLSGGLLRRLNIACGIAHQPKLIFMDEPTVAVDPQSRNAILEGIRRLNAQGATIVYTSHYMEEVEEICSRIIIIDKGKTIAAGSKEELKAGIMMKEKIEVEPGVIAYFDRYDSRPNMGYRFSLEHFEGKKLISKLTANSIKYDSLYKWTVIDYMIRDFEGMREHISEGSRKDTTLRIIPSDFLISATDCETMTSPELATYIERQKTRGIGNIQTFQIEYHKRFASIMAAFILTSIGASLSSRKIKGGMGLNIGIGLALSFSYILFTTVTSTFAINGYVSPMVAAWIPNILYTFIAIYLYQRAPR